MAEAEPDLVIDVGSMTFGEMEDLEQYANVSMAKFDATNVSAKVLAVLVWIIKRRDDPKFTLDDARKLPISILGATQVVEGVDPTGPAGSSRKPRK